MYITNDFLKSKILLSVAILLYRFSGAFLIVNFVTLSNKIPFIITVFLTETRKEEANSRTKMTVLRTDKKPTELYDFKEILGR